MSPACAGGFVTTEPPGNPGEIETKPQVYEQLLRSRKHSPLEAASGSLCVCVCVCVCARARARVCVCVYVCIGRECWKEVISGLESQAGPGQT